MFAVLTKSERVEYHMTKLEKEMSIAMTKANVDFLRGNLASINLSKAAAEVAKKYIEKAWDAAETWQRYQYREIDSAKSYEDWLKENGIV